MNNDDVKKYINLSKLYTEVQLDEEKKQVDENWFTDLIKKTFNMPDSSAEELDKTAKKAGIDTEDPEGEDAKKAGIDPLGLANPTSDDVAADQQQPKDKPRDGGNPGGTTVGAAPNQYNKDAAGNLKPFVGTKRRTFDSINDAQKADNLKAGMTIEIDGKEAEVVDDTVTGQQFFVHPGTEISITEPKPDGSIDAVGSEEDPEVTDQEGGVAQGIDQADADAQSDADNISLDTTAKQEPVNTKDLMTRYNEGGKKAMPEIKKLQTELSRLGFDPNGIDGKYGNGTFKAVQQFQKANGLQVDGQAGTNTLAAIKKAITGTPANSTDSTGSGQQNRGDGAPTSNDAQAAQDKADADADATAPVTADQQAQLDAETDVARYIELLNKLEGGEKQAGVPNAELDAQQRGVQTASIDFRHLISLVESVLNEALTDAEAAELEALHTKVQGYVGTPGMNDDKITTALNRYLKLKAGPDGQYDGDDLGSAPTTVDNKGPDGKYDGDDLGNAPTTPAEKPKVTLDSLSAQIKKGITMQQFTKIVQDAAALEPQDAAKDANILKKFGSAANKLFSTADYRSRYVIANGAKNLGLKGLYRPNGKSFIMMGPDGKPTGAAGGSIKDALAVAQVGLLPQSKVDSIGKIAAKGKPDFQAVIDAHNKATGATPQVKKQVPPSTGRPDDAGATQQNASKDNNMKKAIKEASMNISINGDSAAEVAELAGILKNAGMPDAAPVSDIMAPPIDHGHMDGHDDMVSKMRIMDEPAPDDSPCGMGEEGVEEDSWDNSPDETYADTQTMTKDLSGGLNREKKSYPAAQDGDNPMAVENSIKEQLWAALNEKMTEGGKKRGMKMKTLKASRGNEDIQTTEGSKGKKSRGEKKKSSRG